MAELELLRSNSDSEEILVRNVDLARRRVLRRSDEIEVLLSRTGVSRKERMRLLRYAISGLEAAHAELRDALADLAEHDSQE